MKQTISIFFLLLFCNVYGQKLLSNHIDEKSKFKYQYWFKFENTEDISSYNLKKIESISTIRLTDNKGNIINFPTIEIKDLRNDSLSKIVTDFDGLGKLQLKPGKYSMEISAINYDKFTVDFSIIENNFFELNIKLGLAPELTVYQINSKTELNETEILTIMKCVNENRQNFYRKCSESNKFYVSMQI
jgi:hypothetical protein